MNWDAVAFTSWLASAMIWTVHSAMFGGVPSITLAGVCWALTLHFAIRAFR